ncbi:conserved hypothetical protein [Leishmania mexicana MHOM/GT/2001/U1103]|uniref:Uncharacterized protein n=1 Tax=Leishmania mexicana (strain MHOM/GT/2001/U1103) TaxID=929439 RepID=E9B1Q6_LEIMU|nr:conserved hypothetical protein [Leishmania mexicana MHOM/GT/2001/U1103]CBZ29163.1 conserved hypothetical protein [Leishmania mexicana MHOM/GT/2001/U1103]
MQYVSFPDASAATLKVANPLSPAHDLPPEAKAEEEEEDGGLLSNNQSSTSLHPVECTAGLTSEQSGYWVRSASLGMLDSPKDQHGTVCGASLATAKPMYTEVNQPQLISQLAGGISLTEENWCASVLIAENNLAVRDGGPRQAVAKVARITSCSPRSHLKSNSKILSPASLSAPEGRRRENKTEEFFRLAHELKKQRLRLCEQQPQQRRQQPAKRYRGAAKLHTYLLGDSCRTALPGSVEIFAPASAKGSLWTDHDGDEDAVAAFYSSPMQPSVNASQGSGILSAMPVLHHETPLQKNVMPLFLRQTQPLPQTTPQKVDGHGGSRQKLQALLPTFPIRHAWEVEGLDYSSPTTQLCRGAHSRDSDDSDSDSSSTSGFESLPSKQSGRMGVFPALDFPHVRSPDWAILNSMECDASESWLSMQYTSEVAAEGNQAFVFTDVDHNVVPLEVVPPLPETTMLPIKSDVHNPDYRLMQAAAPALSPNRPPVSVSVPTTRTGRVPLWGSPPPAAAATPNPRACKGLITSTLCFTKGSRFTFSAYSSSAHSSGSPTSPNPSLLNSKSRHDNSTVRPLQRQRKQGSSRVPRGDEAARSDVSTDSTLIGGAQGHTNTFAAAPAALLPCKAFMQRFYDRFSTLKKLFHVKPLE